MEYTSHNNYLETEVLTATPQKLQLMLVNGAIRFALQAQHQKNNDQHEEAWESLIRCRGIIAEILGGIKIQSDETLKQVASIYLFLFRELSEIPLEDDYAKLDGIINVLSEEKETWEKLCEIMPEAPIRPEEEIKEITAADMPTNFDPVSLTTDSSQQASSGYDSHRPLQDPHFQESSELLEKESARSKSSGFSLDA